MKILVAKSYKVPCWPFGFDCTLLLTSSNWISCINKIIELIYWYWLFFKWLYFTFSIGMHDNSPPPHCGGGNGVEGVTGPLAAFSCASLALRSFSFNEKIATDLARFIRLCFTRVFFAASSSAAKTDYQSFAFLPQIVNYLLRLRQLLGWKCF